MMGGNVLVGVVNERALLRVLAGKLGYIGKRSVGSNS